ncbi:MAG: tRNA (adenosine(37)-N6)-dimethylallyltransferase MiaA [Sphingobacteriales bacterium JAD_PAG50586_3]|nr:MAG: tRNA (adenosine(37)-N6)-dimethylallyltransferase MiaA [Sphingobacteriales bacterium JAD_PAG50586_3]
MNNTKHLIAVVGPTASGKTGLAIQMAKHYNTAILSADSRQFYTELNIGVARPSAEELKAAPHYFIADRSIHNQLTAGQYEKEALTLLDDLFKIHDVVILCGGSGLFINTLIYGADPMPEADEALRANLQKQYEERGIGFLQAELERLDPVYYNTVDKQNPLRLMRAVEVCLVTGQPYSAQRKNEKKERPFKTTFIGIDVERELLYQNINNRVDAMMQNGLLAEAHAVFHLKHLSTLQTVGYSELFNYFDGHADLDTAVDLIKRNSRRYAKRQLTWFRRNEEIQWFKPEQTESILSYLNGYLV